jgi:hypothetical protein
MYKCKVCDKTGNQFGDIYYTGYCFEHADDYCTACDNKLEEWNKKSSVQLCQSCRIKAEEE